MGAHLQKTALCALPVLPDSIECSPDPMRVALVLCVNVFKTLRKHIAITPRQARPVWSLVPGVQIEFI